MKAIIDFLIPIAIDVLLRVSLWVFRLFFGYSDYFLDIPIIF